MSIVFQTNHNSVWMFDFQMRLTTALSRQYSEEITFCNKPNQSCHHFHPLDKLSRNLTFMSDVKISILSWPFPASSPTPMSGVHTRTHTHFHCQLFAQRLEALSQVTISEAGHDLTIDQWQTLEQCQKLICTTYRCMFKLAMMDITALMWYSREGKLYLRVHIRSSFGHARSQSVTLAWPVTLSTAGWYSCSTISYQSRQLWSRLEDSVYVLTLMLCLFVSTCKQMREREKCFI